MTDIRNVVHGLKPALLMLVVQIGFASVSVLYKLAINDGMSVRVLTAYRLIFCAASTAILALIFERKNRSKLTWRVVLMLFFCGLFGVTGAVLIVIGLYMVLWGKSKETKKVTDQLVSSHITPEFEEIDVVVTSTTVDHDNSGSSHNSHRSCNINIVAKGHDNSIKKSEHDVV